MRIGLINIEPKIFNTAYMQIARYHGDKGDQVEWWDQDKIFDKLYCSSLFDYTDKSKIPKNAICGGTGFDIKKKLPKEIEDCNLDYSIYPNCKTSYVWFSRGCSRDCPFCCVRQKEGKFHLVKRKQLNTWGRFITIMDNDFFANPQWRDVVRWLGRCPVDIQNIDARKLTEEMCKALNGLRRWKNKRFKIAWDNPKENLEDKLHLITKHVKPDHVTCYVLVGFNSTMEENLHRIETLRGMGINPYIMRYDMKNEELRHLARYVNGKQIFKSTTWEEYKKTKAVFKEAVSK